jgi:hypothetical protein
MTASVALSTVKAPGGEICQSWHDEIAALLAIQLHVALLPLLLDNGKWKLEGSQCKDWPPYRENED